MAGDVAVAAIRRDWLGNCFASPTAEYLVIGSLWSVVATGLVLIPSMRAALDTTALLSIVVFVNSAHFAASTVRLYSRRAFREEYPFLTFVFPLITMAVLLACILMPESLGKNLWSLYLTWSPYHYAAQAYGLSVMYAGRSGLRFSKPEQRAFFWICLLPFFVTMTKSGLQTTGAGLPWLLPADWLARPEVLELLRSSTYVLGALTFLLPLVAYAYAMRTKRQTPPLITLALVGTNGLWWVALDYLQAFTLATIAHGLQYLAITLIFHTREKLREPDANPKWWYHATIFYGWCLGLGYALFYVWPYAFEFAGAGLSESLLMVVATINIHHFIVDRYIWRLRGSPNSKTMTDAPRSPDAAPAPA